MAEQLYKIEKRPAKCGEAIADVFNGTFPTSTTAWTCDVLVPVPVPRTLAWALGEMLAHPMREYAPPDVNHRWRFNGDLVRFEVRLMSGVWCAMASLGDDAYQSTSWSPCEAEPKPVIVPGSRNWLHSLDDGTRVRHTTYLPEWVATKSGDKIIAGWWDGGDVFIRTDDCADMGWSLAPEPQPVPGSREWLASLEDGTEVYHASFSLCSHAIKMGRQLQMVRVVGDPYVANIDEHTAESGWRLRTQPQAAPKTESTIELSHEEWIRKAYGMDEQAAPTLEQRVERLERMMEERNE